ncbi:MULTISPECIES: hypothetical protein [Bacteroides]|uniref:hypothetical protein n=1 Tax=Bacteroides TaxID=816 RepID=UPI0023F55AA7|nr:MULTISPECIES: hypothetical protein [Bacteroides]
MMKAINKKLFIAGVCAGTSLMFSCSSLREPKTMRLFMQARRPNVELPREETGQTGILSEKVKFEQKADTIEGNTATVQDSATDIWRSVELERVDIVASRKVIKQVTMRQGSVRLEFNVKVPGVLIDSCWRVTLTPLLRTNDSTETALPPVVLSGSEFARMQERDYHSYDLFLKGIIDPSAYDSIFLDKKGIARDIRKRQDLYYGLYGKERDRQLAYERWKRLTLDRQNFFNMRTEANRTKLRHRLDRKRIEERVKRYITGKDTVGLGYAYNRKYQRQANFWPMYKMHRELTAARVPGKYRDLYISGRSLSDIKNYAFTTGDSTEISRNRYFFDEIARNEMNDRNRDEIRRRMIRYPYIDSVAVRETGIPGKDYTYPYEITLPVTEGMKKLQLRLGSIVEASDMSTWTPAPSDTLVFVIASLSDLLDRSALERFTVASSGVASLPDSLESEPSYTPEGKEYAEGLRLLQEREYRAALKILEKYPDYNTALCLTCLGYHSEAADLLAQLPKSARREYIYAVVCARLQNAYEAVEHLLEACRRDPDMVLRVNMDPELSDLIPQFVGLKEELDKIASGENGI